MKYFSALLTMEFNWTRINIVEFINKIILCTKADYISEASVVFNSLSPMYIYF